MEAAVLVVRLIGVIFAVDAFNRWRRANSWKDRWRDDDHDDVAAPYATRAPSH